eukprot:m.266153 g.266153  ORF g.266153 m.266153 type:complete len:304 (-) comp65637_c0_seq1:71-982(-)
MDENGNIQRSKLTKAEKKELKQQQKELKRMQKELLKKEKLELKALVKASTRAQSISLRTKHGSPRNSVFRQSTYEQSRASPTSFVDGDGWAITPNEVIQATVSQAEVNGGTMDLDTVASFMSRASSRRSSSSPLQRAMQIQSTSTTPTKHQSPIKLMFSTPSKSNVLQDHKLMPRSPNIMVKTPTTTTKKNRRTKTPTPKKTPGKDHMIPDPLDQLSPFSQVVRKASVFIHEFLPDSDVSTQRPPTRKYFNARKSPTSAEKKARFGQYRRRRTPPTGFVAQDKAATTQQPNYHKIKQLGGWRY